MTEISFDTRIVGEESEIGIPEIVRYRTQLLLQNTKRITIEAQTAGGGGKYAKANGFKLTAVADNDGYPAEEIEDVTEAIMRCVLHKYRERVAADPSTEERGCSFRIVFDRRTPTGKRERPGIELLDWRPDGPDMPVSAADRDAAEGQATATHAFELVDKLMVRMDGLIEHIVKLSSQGKDMFEPLVKMMAIANQNQVVGMTMQRNAMEYIYSTKRLEEEEAGKDRRAEKWMEFLKMPAKQAVAQFGKYMRTRAANGRVEDDEDEDEDDDRSNERVAPPRARRQRAASTSASSPSADSEETIEHPCAAVATVTGQLLEPGQWAAAAQMMTKKQMRLFGKIFECETDDEVIECWDALQESLPLTKMLQLNKLLTSDQQKQLEILTAMIEKAREGWPEDDDGDAPSGAED